MAVSGVADVIAREREAYAQGEDRPIGSYGVLMSVYGAGVAAAATYVRRRKRPLPERIGAADFATIAVATHKLSRLIAKDSVTAVVRAPFTEFEEAAGEGEVHERVRGDGLRHAIGELLTCPFCLSQWIATAFMFGLVIAPRATRLAASTFAAVAASDYLQFVHSAVKRQEHNS